MIIALITEFVLHFQYGLRSSSSLFAVITLLLTTQTASDMRVVDD